MQQTSARRLGHWRRTAAAVTMLAAFAAACGTEHVATDPNLPGNPPSNPQLRNAAFILDVNTRNHTVKVTDPLTGASIGPSSGISASLVGQGGTLSGSRNGPRGPVFSILAGDAVQLTTSNYSASTVGQFQPGKIRVAFDVNVTNKLSGVQFITPTFPVPPAGTNGIILFPFETNVTVTTGGTTVGGDGTEVTVEQPNRGQVDASSAWDGDPFNFFNDTGCGAGANDCYRYQTFAQPLGAGSTSEAQSVGFDIDPTVATFRVRLIVAADLANSGPALTGSIAGSVTSPQRGALSGVTVTSTPGGINSNSDASGAYTLAGVATGPKSVALSGLPAGCTNPGAQNTTVTANTTSTVNFSVVCTTLVGTVQGTISSSQGGGISGVSVVVTPTGLSAQPGVTTAGSGAYSAANVPVGVGTGSIALSNLPANCTNPGTTPYSGLTSGGVVTVDITVPCTPPPQGYALSASWGPISGGTVTLTLSIDMGSFNDPAINGAAADDIFAIQGTLTYSTARLTFGSCSNVGGSGLQNLASNGSVAGTLQYGNFTTIPSLQTGAQGIATCTFNVVAGAPASVTPGNSISVAESAAGDDLVPRILFTNGTLSIP